MTTNNAMNKSAVSDNGYSPSSSVAAGTPNGTKAGTIGDFYFDSTNLIGYTCTATGNSSTAVWTADASSGNTLTWVNVTGATQTMAPNTGYIANNASGSTAFTLPATIAVTQRFSIRGGASTSWSVAQGSGQICHFGTVATTSGAGGSLSSTNQYDQLDGICITANTTFSVSCPQGNLTYV